MFKNRETEVGGDAYIFNVPPLFKVWKKGRKEVFFAGLQFIKKRCPSILIQIIQTLGNRVIVLL